MLALAARYHRGSRPKKKHDEFRALGEEDRHRVAASAAILRLALALDRTHQQRVQEVRVLMVGDSVEITVDAQGDADVDLWAARTKVKLFEKVFDREIVFSVSDGLPRPAAQDRDRSTTSLDSNSTDQEDDPVDAAGNPVRPR